MSGPASVFFRSGTRRLHAVRHAGAGRRPIVVVPGITTPAGAIAFAARRLASTAGDVYVLDMRGRGLSERVEFGAHRAADYAEDVVSLIEQAGLDRPILVGHSLGARVVAHVRAQLPGCSSGVVAIDPPMSGPGRRPYPTGLNQFLEGIQAARSGYGEKLTREHYPAWTDEQVAARGEWLGSCDEVAVVESYAWFHLEAFEPVWQEVEPPALLLFGEESPVVTHADAAELERLNPRAAVISIPKTEIERRVVAWIEPYSQAWHLMRARDWLVHLDGEASVEMRLATVTHDIERMFPNGPSFDKRSGRWDDPDYLYAHASRSAAFVGAWLEEQGTAADGLSIGDVRRLITLHEFGGLDGADLVQAADSLSFLETLQDVVRSWVEKGECGIAQARAKHQYMADRIRMQEARRLAEPLLATAMASLDDLES